MRICLYLALFAPLFFLAASPAVATSAPAVQPVATTTTLDDQDPQEHPDCGAKWDRLFEIDDEITEKMNEQDRFIDLLGRYDAAGAGGSPAALAIKGFIEDLDVEILALMNEYDEVWAWIVAHNCSL